MANSTANRSAKQHNRTPSTKSTSTTVTSEARELTKDFTHYLRDYAREKPEIAALWCFGFGFILGWKIKPW